MRSGPCGLVKSTSQKGTVEDVDLAVASARRAYASWSLLTSYERSRHLYSVARHLQKHARLLAVIEAMDNGKTIRETRDADVPVAVRKEMLGLASMWPSTLIKGLLQMPHT